MNTLQAQISQLPPQERLDLIDEIWAGLGSGALPVPDEVLDELDRRREHYNSHPESVQDWGEFRAGLEIPRRETD